MEMDKMIDVGTVINSVGATLKTSAHVNAVIKTVHTLVISEFVLHMSKAALAAPKRFHHVYEWNQIGNPNARLWQHSLRGGGANRISTFNFSASKLATPVAPALRAVGVQKNHIFYMKAAVMEFGLPVRISPKIAKALVFEDKGGSRAASSTGKSWKQGGLVYSKGTIYIPRQGNQNTWYAFSTEYDTWFNSNEPSMVIEKDLTPKVIKTIEKNFFTRVKSIVSRPKTVSFQPSGLDNGFIKTLQNSLKTDYIAAARQRRTLTDD
jgi:hypothetical protein